MEHIRVMNMPICRSQSPYHSNNESTSNTCITCSEYRTLFHKNFL